MKALLAASLLAACSSSPKPVATGAGAPVAPTSPAASVPVPVTTVMTADTPATDLDGNAFLVPAQWKLTTTPAMVVLTTPEDDSRVALVNVTAETAEAARDLAWKAYKPDAAWPLLSTTESPPRDGWTRGKTFGYQTSPAEKRTIRVSTLYAAAARRWCAIVIDVSDATGEKRGGQFAKVFSHFYPKGFSRESFEGKVAAKLDAPKLEALRQFVADAAAATGVPGVSFGVMQDGKVVWSGGVGVRELGKPAKVDAKTLFMIASNTKTLTTLMLAKLVDAKRLAWDAPVTTELPAFKLGNADVTKQVQVKHLICACTGMPRQDLEWLLEWKGSTPASVLASLGTMEPTSKFGELFQYSNLMAAAGGYVGGHVAFPKLELGAAYDRAMQTLVFTPLGMKATTFDYALALRGNHAMPHGFDIEGHVQPAVMMENYSIRSARPAGAAWSNVDDLLKYLAMELGEGKLPDGTQYIGKEALQARQIPNVAIGSDAAYGMGLFLHHKYDLTVIDHGGDLIGYHSDMMWIPSANVAAVVLTNGDQGNVIRDQFLRRLMELLYDGKPEALENVQAAAKVFATQLEVARKQLTVPADPAFATTLAAHYHNDKLGDVRVTHAGGKTSFDVGEFASEVGSSKNPDGSISYTTLVPGLIGLEFEAGGPAAAPTLTMRDGQHEYVFAAMP